MVTDVTRSHRARSKLLCAVPWRPPRLRRFASQTMSAQEKRATRKVTLFSWRAVVDGV